MKEYETNIGLEIHVQLKTKSKMFCDTSAAYFGAEPNSHTCPVCLGLPGALPVVNKQAIDSAIKFALGLNCEVSLISKFDRKNYFYPDLPKGFQISQLDLPIGKNGFLEVEGRKIRINRAHQEEDTGKLIHRQVNGKEVSLVDFNRSGVPLMEVVSEPDIDSPHLAKEYAKAVHRIARYLEVSEGDMEKAGMRFDGNISIRPKGQKKLGEKVEVKNINSFKFLERALAYEIERQVEILEGGGKIVQETRGWVESKRVTVSQRTKEGSPDYRYFPEPDLPPLQFKSEQIMKAKEELPELPKEKEKRFTQKFGLDTNTIQSLIEDKKVAQWYENTLEIVDDSKQKARNLANWMVEELLPRVKEKNITINEAKVEPAGLIELLNFVEAGKINQTTAKQILSRMLETGKLPAKIIQEEGLSQLDDIDSIVREVISENPKAVEDIKKGNEASISFLVGQVMKKTLGKANPQRASEILKDLLNGN